MKTNTNVAEVLIDEETIRRRISALAAAIRRDAGPDTPVHLVAVLKGAFMFLADLLKAFEGPVTCDFLGVSSYSGGIESTGQVKLTKDLDQSLAGRYVVLVEDIIDTGLTLSYLLEILQAREPVALKTACLLSKPSRRRIDVPVEYIGFEIDDKFVIGYGLDYNELYRDLPYVGVMRVGA